MISVCGIMTTDPVTIGATTTVRRAVELLQTLDIRHLPIVNEKDELIGMLSDRDLRALSIPAFIGPDYVGELRTALDARVGSFMTGDVLSVDLEADVREAVNLMLEHKIGAVPVTDADGVVVGIVSYVDVLRALPLDRDAAE